MGVGEPVLGRDTWKIRIKLEKCLIFQGFEGQYFQFVPETYKQLPFHLSDSKYLHQV